MHLNRSPYFVMMNRGSILAILVQGLEKNIYFCKNILKLSHQFERRYHTFF